MILRHVSFAIFAVFLTVPATSYALDAPKGEVILTVRGSNIGHPNVGSTAQFDLAMLEALAGRRGAMETPWTNGKVTFSGPLFRAVLDAAGAQGTKIKVAALNDYTVEIPMDDALNVDTMLATRMDGKLMTIRDKGPIFLIYPFDKDRSLYNEKYFSRSVWQIATIEVLP